MNKILLINGPNLNKLGQRNPDIYGVFTIADVENCVQGIANEHSFSVKTYQSNSESNLIRFIEENSDSMGAIINPGALMMAGWSLRDALEMYSSPWIEVHISNIFNREQFRHQSILAPLSSGFISGCGLDGYMLAATHLFSLLKKDKLA